MESRLLKEFRDKVVKKEIKIAIIGLGYVGLPLAVAFAKKGFQVQGIDKDKDRVDHVKHALPYILDVDTKDIKKVVRCGLLVPMHNFSSLKEVDAIIICVPTPLKRKYQPNIAYILNAVRQIKKQLKKGQLVVLESTTYPGTTDEVILPLLESGGLKHGRDFHLAFSPERIDPGNKRFDVTKITKIIGGVDYDAGIMTKILYQEIIKKLEVVSSSLVAETVKLFENTFRIVNIGLVDEMAMMAHKMNVDIWEVVRAASTKPFGFMPFYPGPGVGGHCIAKDPLYLYWKAKLHGFKSRFIKVASDVVSYMPEYVVNRVADLLAKKGKKLSQSKILIIGVTYKKDVKDLRKSPALDIINILDTHRTEVHYFDPLIPYLKINHINLRSIRLDKKHLKSFDCVIIAAAHSSIDYKFILRNSRLIFDTRNIYQAVTEKKVVRL